MSSGWLHLELYRHVRLRYLADMAWLLALVSGLWFVGAAPVPLLLWTIGATIGIRGGYALGGRITPDVDVDALTFEDYRMKAKFGWLGTVYVLYTAPLAKLLTHRGISHTLGFGAAVILVGVGLPVVLVSLALAWILGGPVVVWVMGAAWYNLWMGFALAHATHIVQDVCSTRWKRGAWVPGRMRWWVNEERR